MLIFWWMHGGESFCEFSDVGPIEVLDHYFGLGSWRHLHSSSNYGELNSRFPCHRAKFHPILQETLKLFHHWMKAPRHEVLNDVVLALPCGMSWFLMGQLPSSVQIWKPKLFSPSRHRSEGSCLPSILPLTWVVKGVANSS